MAVVIAVTLVGMKWTFNTLKKTSPMGSTVSPLVTETTPRSFRRARACRSQPHQELKDYCEAQQNEVNTYGWVDQRQRRGAHSRSIAPWI